MNIILIFLFKNVLKQIKKHVDLNLSQIVKGLLKRRRIKLVDEYL